jgi:putative tryptophan/tyrosine transport system substrate-binding protein
MPSRPGEFHPESLTDPDVIVKRTVIAAAGDPGIHAAQQATKTIPILGYTDDMVGSGFVSSIARPNGNITGVSLLTTELDGKRQEILIEAVPGVSRNRGPRRYQHDSACEA